jgi:hypothetical protein
VKDVGDIHVLGYVDCLSGDDLQDLVVLLKRAKWAASANLYELLWYYVYTPPRRACSFEFLKPMLGERHAFLGFQTSR